ncbi:hypothetical protein [Sphingomonas panacis]|uniref:hypothetical protein n=1 Tax=Sphingomonas panacis TaxID=1560345 RepID=UPI0014710AA1|nr:hypothetical protein [Sphingomonas panacis]
MPKMYDNQAKAAARHVIGVRRFNDRQTLTPCQYQFPDMGDFASLFGAQEAA